MKNLLKLFGIIALVAVIGFSMIACDDGSGDSGSNPTSATFTSYDAQGNSYTLVVTKNPDRAAAYSPQNGDTFVLTIRDANNAVVGTSSGTVAEVSGTTFTLEKGGETFTVTCSGGTIETIANPIPLDAGGTRQPPETLTPNKPSNGGNGNDPTNSTLTVTNIPSEHNGKYVLFQGNLDNSAQTAILGYKSLTETGWVLPQIVNGSVTIPLWLTRTAYTGNDIFSFAAILINTASDLTDGGSIQITFPPSSISFANGNATISWEQGQ